MTHRRKTSVRSRLTLGFSLACVLALFPLAVRSASQDPKEEPKDPPKELQDEVGEVATVDISAVGPVSFDGDVRELTPVPMSAQIDLLEEMELPELPVGPDFPSA